MTVANMETAAAFTAKLAIEAGDAMEGAFSSARSGDRDGALAMAKEATTLALRAKKAMTAVLQSQTASTQLTSRVALGHVEDARLFAKAAMDVARGFTRRIGTGGGGEAGKKSAEVSAFLMAAASTMLDMKRGTILDTSLRKVAMAAERAQEAAQEAVKLGGPFGDDANAAQATAAEIARRALWAVREAKA